MTDEHSIIFFKIFHWIESCHLSASEHWRHQHFITNLPTVSFSLNVIILLCVTTFIDDYLLFTSIPRKCTSFFLILQVTWRVLLCRVNLPLYFSFTPTSHLWFCQPIQRKKHIVVTSPSTPFCKSSSPPLIHKGRITFKIATFFSISQNSSYICVK